VEDAAAPAGIPKICKCLSTNILITRRPFMAVRLRTLLKGGLWLTTRPTAFFVAAADPRPLCPALNRVAASPSIPLYLERKATDIGGCMAVTRSGCLRGSVTLPNIARNKSPGTSGSRSSDGFTPRLHGRCPKDSVRSCRCEMTLGVECVVDCCVH
jgi:hypothetical protein